MATAAQSRFEWSRRRAWVQGFLREELAPYPGRGAMVARMALATSIVMMLIMIFRIPFGAYAGLFALTISRENLDLTRQDVATIVISFSVAVATALAGALLFSSDPVPRVVWVLATFFLCFFALSALSNYSAAARFGYMTVVTTPIWDEHIPANAKVEATLWAVAALSMASVITLAVELVFAHFKPRDDFTASIAERLHAIDLLLRSYIQGSPDPACQQKIVRFSMLGTSRMRRALQRSGGTEQYAEKMGAVVAFTGRLVDIAANLTDFHFEDSPQNRRRLRSLSENIAGLGDDLLAKRTPRLMNALPEAEGQDAIPFFREMERTVSLIADVFTGTRPVGAVAGPFEPAEPSKGLFVVDAFTNPEHIRFGLKGGLAASICYITYNLIAWPGISTCVTTCVVTALTTIGSSRQRQVLRFSGALVGGVIGMAAQVFVLPGLESISGFLLLFLAVTILAAWIATSGPRLSYFGAQVALAFYLINLQEFRFQTSLGVARDRVVGVLLGLFVMWLVFDQIWGASALMEMTRTFTATLRLLAQFQREPVSADFHQAIERNYSLRNTINSNFEKLREQADAVMLEFGPTRQHDLAVRAEFLRWQLQLRTIFIARVALFKYRLRLPGFELTPPAQAAQKDFDQHMAAALDGMADRLTGKAHRAPERSPIAFEDLKQVVEQCCPDDREQLAAQKRTFLPLSHRLEAVVRALDQEI